MKKLSTLISVISFLSSISFSQTITNASVISTIELDNSFYSFIKEINNEVYYKTNVYTGSKLNTGQKIELEMNKTSVYILNHQQTEKIYCFKIKSPDKTITSAEKSIERDERDETIISPFPFCQTDTNPIGGGIGYETRLNYDSQFNNQPSVYATITQTTTPTRL